VSADRDLLEQAGAQVRRQLGGLPEPHRGYAGRSIAVNGGLVLAADRDEAIAIANDYAPEHLQLAVADPEAWLEQIRYAGTALLGQWTTFAASNFAIGTPATLPTTGFAKVTSGITAATYLTRTAIAQLDDREFWDIAPAVTALATHEGFPAHAASVAIRRP
jgi:histidinol dehydrogenase